jgi:hypothetical protein
MASELRGTTLRGVTEAILPEHVLSGTSRALDLLATADAIRRECRSAMPLGPPDVVGIERGYAGVAGSGGIFGFFRGRREKEDNVYVGG